MTTREDFIGYRDILLMHIEYFCSQGKHKTLNTIQNTNIKGRPQNPNKDTPNAIIHLLEKTL